MFSNRNVHETSQKASKSRQKKSIITLMFEQKRFFVFNGYLFRKILFRPISVLSGMF